MARGDRAIGSRRRLWRRHRSNREAVEVWDQQARNRLIVLPEAIWANGAKTAASMAILTRNESRIWKLPMLLLGDQEVKTSYRIKQVSDGSWWQISRTDIKSSDHFKHCLTEKLEQDG